MAFYDLSGVETDSFIANFPFSSPTISQCTSAPLTAVSTHKLRIILPLCPSFFSFNFCPSFAFNAVAVVMPARPLEPGKRNQRKQFCHRSSRAVMPPSLVVNVLAASQHVMQWKEMVSFHLPVLWARGLPGRPLHRTRQRKCACIANIPCHNIFL